MPKSFEKEFISFCENQDLEVNANQIAVIKKLEQETKKATAVKKLPEAVSMIDKLSKNNIIHKNKAAHLKSKLTKKVNSLK